MLFCPLWDPLKCHENPAAKELKLDTWKELVRESDSNDSDIKSTGNNGKVMAHKPTRPWKSEHGLFNSTYNDSDINRKHFIRSVKEVTKEDFVLICFSC